LNGMRPVGSFALLQPLHQQTVACTLRALTPVVDSLYPRGSQLLAARLDDAVHGKARCTVAIANASVAALAVESPKGSRQLKLSTLWVAPHYRCCGLGTALIKRLRNRWLLTDVERVHLTACTTCVCELLALLERFGFRHQAVELNRYGEGRDEAVLIWRPEYCEPEAHSHLDWSCAAELASAPLPAQIRSPLTVTELVAGHPSEAVRRAPCRSSVF